MKLFTVVTAFAALSVSSIASPVLTGTSGLIGNLLGDTVSAIVSLGIPTQLTSKLTKGNCNVIFTSLNAYQNLLNAVSDPNKIDDFIRQRVKSIPPGGAGCQDVTQSGLIGVDSEVGVPNAGAIVFLGSGTLTLYKEPCSVKRDKVVEYYPNGVRLVVPIATDTRSVQIQCSKGSD
ncbi:hypothetical protein HK097_009024 [Rhizophlyctis rosea]|uniref:Uncharacterized protein n=1 Tax=Rhizophlyctis rosea TaxID=64517 RepID=A0AAD5X1C1_9FUNG|nr:hypothetical protein HK097_009024 [Rhizophlyctis rosea]